jgi:hypothetical protein
MFNPQSLNRYSYVTNNPVNFVDPDGFFHRHKKSGNFFSRFFGFILRLVFPIVAFANPGPVAWEGF